MGLIKHVKNRNAIDQAIRDIQWSRGVLAGSPFVVLSDLYVHTTAIQFGREHGLDTSAWEEAAARAADELKQFPDYFCMLQSFYYQTMGDERTANAMLARAYELGHGGPPVRAARAYGRGDDRQALKELEGLDYNLVEGLRALLTAESDRDAALAMHDEMIQRQEARGRLGAFDPGVLFICGEHQKAARLARQRLDMGLVAADPETDSVALAYGRNVLQFVVGELTEEEFLAAASEPPFPSCANLLAGLRHLSTGDREAAKVRFQKAIEPFYPGVVQFHLSEAFLQRMEADAHWPSSIPRTEHTETLTER